MLIILQVGHNTKALAISFIPLALAGFFLLIDKRWLYGFILSVLGLGLNIRANHYQMSYYLLFILVMFLVFLIDFIKKNDFKAFIYCFSVFTLSSAMALMMNAPGLLSTKEYSEFSTRSKSEITINPDGSKKASLSGLSKDYITEYSYGIFESLSLIIPRVQGGGSRENLGTESELYEFLVKKGVSIKQAKNFVSSVPTYWGSQPILEAPAYIGIVVFFFAVFAMIILKGPIRNALMIASILSLILSWGKNFPIVTDFFIYNVPFYNKFRSVSSAQVILELCIPVLAALGLQKLLSNPQKYFKPFLKTTIGILGFLISLILLKIIGLFSFKSAIDIRLREAYGEEILEQIIFARREVFNDDILRGVFLVIITFLVFMLYKSQKIKKNIAIVLLFGLLIYDLGGVAVRYLDWSRFVDPSQIETPFRITNADEIILNDKSRYRVYEPELNLTGARTAYFHNSLGGYHGAKPRRFQELFQFFNFNQIPDILNMLNVKYVLYQSKEELSTLINEEAQGNAWFVDSIIRVKSADEVLESFKTIDLKNQAVVEDELTAKALTLNENRDHDESSIKLIEDSVNLLRYSFVSKSKQVVVFSEMYYPDGWSAKIKEQAHSDYINQLPNLYGNNVVLLSLTQKL